MMSFVRRVRNPFLSRGSSQNTTDGLLHGCSECIHCHLTANKQASSQGRMLKNLSVRAGVCRCRKGVSTIPHQLSRREHHSPHRIRMRRVSNRLRKLSDYPCPRGGETLVCTFPYRRSRCAPLALRMLRTSRLALVAVLGPLSGSSRVRRRLFRYLVRAPARTRLKAPFDKVSLGSGENVTRLTGPRPSSDCCESFS